jgi:hypothetical protein
MGGPFRQLGVCAAMAAAAATAWTLAGRSRPGTAEAGFWFDDVAFRSVRLGGALSRDDLGAIEATARAELQRAFAGLPIRVSDRRDATFRIRVAQEVRDRRLRGNWGVAGESFSLPGLGGHATVSFQFLASGATAHAPDDLGRADILAAIGRGIGRTAAHELAHLIVPGAPIHDSPDVASYEFDSAARHEQYFGEMHWAIARPWLEARLGRPTVGY